MTKKHYTAIAKVISEVRYVWLDQQGPIRDIEDKLVEYFKSQNPSFDQQKFLKACKEKNDSTLQ